MSDIQDMISTLANAKLAMDENPALKARIEELEDKLFNMELELNCSRDRNIGLADENETLIQSKAELEASLEAARFQELATHSKLDKLVSSFSAAITEVCPPVSVDSNSGEPVLVAQSPDVGLVPQTSSSPEVGLDWPVRTETWPEATVTEPKSEIVPEGPESTPQTWDTPHIEEQPIGEPISTLGCTDPEPHLQNDIIMERKPYAGKPYSFKPESMSWSEWANGGGQTPWYINPDGSEKYPQSA